MWCKDITECLITEGDRLEAMKGAEQMCVQVRWQYLFSYLRWALWCFLNKKIEKEREGYVGRNELSCFWFFFRIATDSIFLWMSLLLVDFLSCIVFSFLESKQACSFGSWRASKTNQKYSVCFDHNWCTCQGYSHRNGGTSGNET